MRLDFAFWDCWGGWWRGAQGRLLPTIPTSRKIREKWGTPQPVRQPVPRGCDRCNQFSDGGGTGTCTLQQAEMSVPEVDAGAGFHEAGRDSAESERGSRPGFREVRGERPGHRVGGGVPVRVFIILLFLFFSIFFFAGWIFLRDSFRGSKGIFYK